MPAIVPLPPSHHHKNKQAKREWAERARDALRSLACPISPLVAIHIDYYGPWLKDDGTPDPKQPDLKNLYWELEDLVEKATGRNDRCHFRAVLTKHTSPRNVAVVELKPWR